MKILVVSSTPWNNNNSFGNSYANIFDNLKGCEFANIYCAEGCVNDPVVKRAYQITTKRLFTQIIHKQEKAGKEVPIIKSDAPEDIMGSREKKILDFAKKNRWMVFFWARELVWKIGKWDSEELKQFVEDFSPDILFCPVYQSIYLNRVLLRIHEISQVPMLCYISDDNYTLRCVSLSPLFWINRMAARRWVKKSIDASKILYVISETQKKDYDKIFHKNSRILTKGANFSQTPPIYCPKEKPYQLLFAGNIGGERWKSLAEIGNAIKKLNTLQPEMQLTVYTSTPLTPKMRKCLNIPGCIQTKTAVPYTEIQRLQQKADILIHVEPRGFHNSWRAYHGFSTKLVDYMALHHPILAYGCEAQASISHLKQHDAAMVATTPQELEQILQSIVSDKNLLKQYGEKAWDCGTLYHEIQMFHTMLKKDFEEVLLE